MSRCYLVFILLFFPSLACAENADIFPQKITSQNASLKFEVDSTWHRIEGVAKAAEGKVWLEDASDLHSIHADILFPVKSLDTDNSMRDDRLREVMNAEKYPNVRFEVVGVTKACDLEALRAEVACGSKLKGKLTIRDVSKDLIVPVTVRRQEEHFSVSGETSIRWDEYGVEDPSILVAKLDKKVAISFEVQLADKARSEK